MRKKKGLTGRLRFDEPCPSDVCSEQKESRESIGGRKVGEQNVMKGAKPNHGTKEREDGKRGRDVLRSNR